MQPFRFFEQRNDKEVKVPISLIKVALKYRKVRAVQVLYAAKYCLGLSSQGHVDLSQESKAWLAATFQVSIRTIDRDLKWLRGVHLLKQDKVGWRVAGHDRMHWNLWAQTGTTQDTALGGGIPGKEARGTKGKSTRVHHFKLKLNFILVDHTKVRDIFTTLIVGKNLRDQSYRQAQKLIKSGRVPKKWRNIENLCTEGQWLAGDSLAAILGTSVRQAYILRAYAHLTRSTRIYIEPGCRDKDILLELGRQHYGMKSGGVVYAGPGGCLVFRTADLLRADYSGALFTGRTRTHWAYEKFNLDKKVKKSSKKLAEKSISGFSGGLIDFSERLEDLQPF